MSTRELVMLGTASQAPTRERNHNATVLRWDGHSMLFDPGEGAQRQFAKAGLSVAAVDRVCISHFHGDHCLGLPGVILRMALDNGHLPVPIHYPASGERYFERLCGASAGQEELAVDARPIDTAGVIHSDDTFTIRCARLSHRIETFGFRLEEPDGRRFVPERLEELGLRGRVVGELRENGSVVHGGRTVHVDEVSEPRAGQVVAYVMDTAWCDAALELAEDADLLVCESTFLACDEGLAAEYGHLTAQQAGRLARVAGARRLVLGHFSRRYDDDPDAYGREARTEFDDVVVPDDLDRIPVPAHR